MGHELPYFQVPVSLPHAAALYLSLTLPAHRPRLINFQHNIKAKSLQIAMAEHDMERQYIPPPQKKGATWTYNYRDERCVEI